LGASGAIMVAALGSVRLPGGGGVSMSGASPARTDLAQAAKLSRKA